MAFVGFCSLHSTRKGPRFGWLSLHLFLSFVVGYHPYVRFVPQEKRNRALMRSLYPCTLVRSFLLSFLRLPFRLFSPFFFGRWLRCWFKAPPLRSCIHVRWPRSFPWGEHRIIVKRRLSSSSPAERWGERRGPLSRKYVVALWEKQAVLFARRRDGPRLSHNYFAVHAIWKVLFNPRHQKTAGIGAFSLRSPRTQSSCWRTTIREPECTIVTAIKSCYS